MGKKTKEEYIAIFEEMKEVIRTGCKEGARMIQCLDEVSFGGKYYYPQFVVVDEGKIYSLASKKWLEPSQADVGHKRKDGTYSQKTYKINKTVSVHKLVANYFCDKRPVEKYGEANVEVHHIIPFDPSKSCEENNNAENLSYTYKQTHREIITKIQKGTYEASAETDLGLRIMMNTVHAKQGSTVHTEIDENGKEVLKLCIKLGGTKEAMEAKEQYKARKTEAAAAQ